MKKKNIIITVAAVTVAAAIIVPRVLRPKENNVTVTLPVVSVEKPQMGDIELSTGLIGTVEPSDIVYITPKLAGEVTDVYVKAGDYVEEGQKLLHIDTKQVDGAKISLDTAAVSLQDANTNLQRMNVLLQSGDISRQQYEQASSSARMAKLQYDAAKLAYDNQIEFSTITAPIGGKVESFNVEPYDNVSQSNVLCVITGEGARAVSFNVTERVAAGLKEGDAIRVEKNGSEYRGVISELSSMVDASTGLFKVKATLEGGEALSTGAQVKLYVISARAENVMTVPTDAIYHKGGQAMVYTYKDSAVHEVMVKTGIYDSQKTEIEDGLTINDDVIVTWSSELFEGSQVKVQQKENKTAGEAGSAPETDNAALSDMPAQAEDTAKEE